MTAVLPRVPSPRLKAPATAGTTTDSATGLNSKSLAPPATPSVNPSSVAPADPPVSTSTTLQPEHARSNSHVAARRPGRPGRPPPTDPLSDKATFYLIRRTLCASHPREKGNASPAPIEDLLPPLTTRNDVDLQLYAFLSIILRDFVQNWYNKITPDQAFVAEIVQIIAHVTRALEQRLRNVDLEHLLFQELPELLGNHIDAYRTAHRRTYGHPIQSNPRQVYHSLSPLPHLSPVPDPNVPGAVAEQEENEANYRQILAQGVMAVLLPTEDLENDCLTSLVGQLLSELIIGDIVVGKASEPWLLWEGITILARDFASKDPPEDDASAPTTSLSQPMSTADISDETTTATTATAVPRSTARTKRTTWSWRGFLWSLIHWMFLAYSFIRFLVSTAILSRSLPSRVGETMVSCPSSHKGEVTSQSDNIKARLLEDERGPVKRPVLAFEIGPCISNLLELDSRMPWFCGVISWARWMAIRGPGRIAGSDGIVDRLLSHFITNKLLDPIFAPPILRTLRGALFPNNAPGLQTLFPPDDKEALLKVRRKCARAVWGLIPRTVARIVFAGTERAILGGGAKLPSGQGIVRLDGSEQIERVESRPVGGVRGEVRIGGRNDGFNQQDATESCAERGKNAGVVVVDEEGKSNDINGLLCVTEPVGQGEREREDEHGEDEAEDGLEDADRVVLDEIETRVLDVFGDVYCNKHLIYSVLELLLVRLLPELGEKGITEMWEERLG